ncbi:MAG: hypothetical protein MRY74_04650 [Neomegalonema sp.]|nr:hypothetical protein [Neomegalonema sp.]
MTDDTQQEQPKIAAVLDVEGDDLQDAIAEVEEIFGLQLDDSAYGTSGVETIGELEDVIFAHADLGSGARCPSAMAFFRLRRAIGPVKGGRKLRPSDRIADHSRYAPIPLAARLKEQSDLRLSGFGPGRQGRIFGRLAIVAFFLLLAAVTAESLIFSLGALLLIISAVAIAFRDPGAFREDETMRDVTRDLVERNIHRLVRQGAKIDKRTAQRALRRRIAAYGFVHVDEIGRESRFFAEPEAKA